MVAKPPQELPAAPARFEKTLAAGFEVFESRGNCEIEIQLRDRAL